MFTVVFLAGLLYLLLEFNACIDGIGVIRHDTSSPIRLNLFSRSLWVFYNILMKDFLYVYCCIPCCITIFIA